MPEQLLPDACQGRYGDAFRDAAHAFAVEKPAAMARRAGGIWHPDGGFVELVYCGERFFASHPQGRVWRESGKDVSESDATLLLLYLAAACEREPQGRWASFLQLPNGAHHNQPFINEAVKPLAREFGNAPERLYPAAEPMGGTALPLGDAAVVMPALPRIPLAFIVWKGDDEFPARAAVLFDSGASLHLDTASLYVLGINASLKLMRRAAASRP